MTTVLRPIEPKDKDQWLKLWCDPQESYIKFYKSLHLITDEISDATFSRFLDPDTPMFAVVAEIDGEIIGFAHYLSHLNTWTIGNTLYLNDLYVKPNMRLGGTGRKLIEYVYLEADKLGCENCYWMTQFENHAAQLLYTKVGKRAGFLVYHRK